jgi:hypothetical protein
MLSVRTMRLALGLLPRKVYDGPLRRAALARAARLAPTPRQRSRGAAGEERAEPLGAA